MTLAEPERLCEFTLADQSRQVNLSELSQQGCDRIVSVALFHTNSSTEREKGRQQGCSDRLQPLARDQKNCQPHGGTTMSREHRELQPKEMCQRPY